jgi:signal transduction histidine kinase
MIFRNGPPVNWHNYVQVVVSAYRLLAFAIATIQLFVFATFYESLLPPSVLIIAVSGYTLFKVLHPLSWHEHRITGHVLLAIDLAVCVFLVLSTGGLYSPFLLYTLAPVLTTALLMKAMVTLIVGGISIAYVIGSHLGNPFFATTLAFPEIGYYLVYIIATGLTAVLPYLINVNLRQRLSADDTLRERQRLSRELHDGTAQTLAAVCWQVQLLRRRLDAMGMDLEEVRKLETLSVQARRDTRDSLEMLRNYKDKGTFLTHLNKYLEHFKLETGIEYNLAISKEGLHLETAVELELLRICQEALANIRKHARASRVTINIKRTNGHYDINIADDGQGFDSLAYYYQEEEIPGHGLAVMRERAESVGGRLRVISTPGKGAEVQVEVPAKHSRVLAWLRR